MKKILTVIILLIPIIVSAQATSSSKLVWNEDGSDLATVQAYVYKYYPDNSATGITFTSVVCSGATTPFSCVAGFPAFTPGTHTLTMSASNAAGESTKSVPFPFTMVVIPAAPTNIRIQ